MERMEKVEKVEKTTVYFGASKGKSFISKIIKWFQWGDPHTHIFYVVSKDDIKNPTVIEAWHEPLLRGGQVRLGKFFEENKYHTKGTEITYYSLSVTPQQKVALEKYLMSKIGFKYDLLGILGFATRLSNTHSSNKYFCSELIFDGLQHIGVDLLKDTVPQSVTPAMFVKSPLLTKLKKVTDVTEVTEVKQ